MPALNDYSPLESFLLFKSLERYGTDPPAFEKIAELLQNNALLENQSRALPNDSRLTATSLRGLFDELVRSESADTGSVGVVANSNGILAAAESTQPSKKRKLQSRSPTPVHELLGSPKRLPQLVARLYHRYVESIVRSIREDEQKYESLQRKTKDDQGQHEDSVGGERGPSINTKTASSGFSKGSSAGDQSTESISFHPPFSITISGNAEGDVRVSRSAHDRKAQQAPGHLPATPKDSSKQVGDVPVDLAEGKNSWPNQVQNTQQSQGAQASSSRGPLSQADVKPIKELTSRGQTTSSVSNIFNKRKKHLEMTADHVFEKQRYTSPYQPTPAVSIPQPDPTLGDVSRSSIPAYLRTTTPAASPKHSTSAADLTSGPQIRQGPASPLTPAGIVQHTQASGLRSRHNTRPSPLQTSASSTRWKQSPQTRPRYSRGSPEPGEVSPLSDGGQAHTPLSWSSNQKDSTGSDSRKDLRKGEVADTPIDYRSKGSIKNQNTMSTKIVGSVSSSMAPRSSRGATRSQSANSHTSFEGDSNIGKNVKYEDPPTPLGLDVDRDFDTGEDTPSNTKGRRSGRGRRTALRGLESAFEGIRGPETTPKVPSDRPGPNYVYCPKNFSRTTAPILNVISGHRIANLFANPVKERDAPGYKDLIYRPQDLKSIKSAITAGGRAAVALAGSAATPTEGVDSPNPGSSTPKGGGAWLPATSDIVPPRGIVNSAQLEKEIMRVFANAVMFNPDPQRGFGPAFEQGAEDGDVEAGEDVPPNHYEEVEGGMVKDTRDMFNAVEQSITSWRAVEGVSVKPNAERGAEHEHLEDETDDAAGLGDRESNADDGGPPTIKRRRRA